LFDKLLSVLYFQYIYISRDGGVTTSLFPRLAVQPLHLFG